MSQEKIPSILLTGASGFVGRYFLETIKDKFKIYALARRPQQELGIAIHPNIKWYLVDIAHRAKLTNVFQSIKADGGVDYVLHLAGYYDFTNEPNPEYQRTNVEGTRNILELTRSLNIKHFIFASSVAACNFPAEGDSLTEESQVDADCPYAWSKREGEKIVTEFSQHFPCSIVRIAAVFSDWCEYGVLYMFLQTWCSKKPLARILGGLGQSAVPFIHIQDLNNLLLIIIDKTESLPTLATYIASPDGCTTHQELFDLSTRLYFGIPSKPFFMPKWLALIGIYSRDILGRMAGRRPFERPWMIKYIDLKLNINSARTRVALNWAPKPRRDIMRRLIYLIEHFKGNPTEWHYKNSLTLKLVKERPNLAIASTLEALQTDLNDLIYRNVTDPSNHSRFVHYNKFDEEKLKWYIDICFNLLISSIRSGDRMGLVNYARFMASIRSREGFSCEELCNFFLDQSAIIIPTIMEQPGLKGMEMQVHDSIRLTIQLAVDEIEDAYEAIEISTRK